MLLPQTHLCHLKTWWVDEIDLWQLFLPPVFPKHFFYRENCADGIHADSDTDNDESECSF